VKCIQHSSPENHKAIQHPHFPSKIYTVIQSYQYSNEDANKENRVDNKRCGSEEEFNKSDANSNSAEQYKLYSVEGVTVDNVTGRNLQFMDFKVKAIDCYYYGINSKNNIKEVEVVEETHKEERIYGRKCEINEEVNKSDVDYNSINQYCFSSIEAADKDRKKNFKLMDSEVKSNDCYNCFDEHKELENSERNEEEKIMSVLGKEPKPPWKITMFTKQEEKRDNICC